MPMTKAEKAEMEALRVRCALSWPPPPPKPVDLDVARAASSVEWLHLWWFRARTGEVGKGVTNGHQHSTHDYPDEQIAKRFNSGSRLTMSQGAGGPWFATESDAYRALHYAVAEDCARKLYNIELRLDAALKAAG